jgi:spermidine/putrescine transport system substrate-binding protein
MDYLERGMTEMLSRRELLRRSAQLGTATGAFALLAAACGGDDETADESPTTTGGGAAEPEPLSGELKFLNYPGWIGAGEYAAFQKLHPDLTIKEDTSGAGSTSAIATRIQADPQAFDFLLLGKAGVPQLEASGVLAEIDFSKIPNIKNMPDRFREAYPWGIPTDYGKIGYAYRKDLVSERPTTWTDFFELAPKYSGKVILLDVLEDTIGNTLISLGHDGNTSDEAEIEEAKDKLISIKPHVQAIIATDVAKPLINGGAVLGMDWDFDIALAQQKQPNIEWVAPDEGLMAYIEGWVAVDTSDQLEAVHAFMDFHLQPKQYADFVNTTGTAYLMPDATPFIKKEITDNPVLAFSEETFDRVTFEDFKGESLGMWTQAWNEVKSA